VTLELRDVVRRYPSEGETVRAVDGASLTVRAGELVALFGPSGSGKTTLLNLAAALDRPDAGTVAFAGERVDRLDDAGAARYRRTVAGVVLQSPPMIAGCDVRDNAAVTLLAGPLGLREARERADAWLERVGIGPRLRGRSPHQLSGGERQRVALARALAAAPRLLLADEPTGSLDSERGGAILALLRDVAAGGVAVLLVTHDPAAAALADRVLEMRDGRVHPRAPRPAPELLAREGG